MLQPLAWRHIKCFLKISFKTCKTSAGELCKLFNRKVVMKVAEHKFCQPSLDTSGPLLPRFIFVIVINVFVFTMQRSCTNSYGIFRERLKLVACMAQLFEFYITHFVDCSCNACICCLHLTKYLKNTLSVESCIQTYTRLYDNNNPIISVQCLNFNI